MNIDINPDAMTEADLEQLETIALNLADYAKVKLAAMRARKFGRIDRALSMEAQCEAIYARLPASVRW